MTDALETPGTDARLTPLDPEARHVTIINTYAVAPERAEALLDMLVRATNDTLRHVPGFVSANFHLNLDRTALVNYAQWRSHEAIVAAGADPAVASLIREAAGIADSFAPVRYELRQSVAGSGERQGSVTETARWLVAFVAVVTATGGSVMTEPEHGGYRVDYRARDAAPQSASPLRALRRSRAVDWGRRGGRTGDPRHRHTRAHAGARCLSRHRQRGDPARARGRRRAAGARKAGALRPNLFDAGIRFPHWTNELDGVFCDTFVRAAGRRVRSPASQTSRLSRGARLPSWSRGSRPDPARRPHAPIRIPCSPRKEARSPSRDAC